MSGKSAVVDVLTATFTALNVAGLTSLLGTTGVRNNAPDDPAFPYVRIEVPDEERWDTFGKAGKEQIVWAHVFSQYRGDTEAVDIVSKVIELLNEVAHSVSSHALARFDFERHFQGGDELIQGKRTTHRIVQFRVNVQQTS